MLHWYVFSPMCDLKCLFKSPFCANALSQYAHLWAKIKKNTLKIKLWELHIDNLSKLTFFSRVSQHMSFEIKNPLEFHWAYIAWTFFWFFMNASWNEYLILLVFYLEKASENTCYFCVLPRTLLSSMLHRTNCKYTLYRCEYPYALEDPI